MIFIRKPPTLFGIMRLELDAEGRQRINAAAMMQIATIFSTRRRRPLRAALAFDRI
jgi:hypothetical protein